MVIWVVRSLFTILIISLLLLGLGKDSPLSPQGSQETYAIICVVVLIFGLWIDLALPRKSLNQLAGVFFGLIVGLMFALAINNVVAALYEAYSPSEAGFVVPQESLKWIITVFSCYLAIVFIMQTKDDFRFIIPYVEFSKQTKGSSPLLLDTSVIIDGRIADIATTGFISDPLVIPRFVLDELQNIADSSDRLRRNRGRRGLDMLNKLQGDKNIDLDIQDIQLTGSEQTEPVDLKLVSSAVKLSGRIVTNDYNLNKVARLRGVSVLNINDLANAIKPILLPGEALKTKIVKVGDQQGQGVGYMNDGTMIVVDNGKRHIGSEVEVLVTSVLQTSAGRMIFGRLSDESPDTNNS